MKKIVWALFDDGNCSVQNYLNKDKYEVYSIGIQQKENVINIDLSLPIIELFRKLDKLPLPDIIVASPVCSSFSNAALLNKDLGAGNATWKIIDNRLVLRDKNDYIGTRYNYERQNINGILGRKLAVNTMLIINNYKPKYWYIENPERSLIWYLYDFGIKNLTHYCMYGLEIKKPTIFLSNVYLNLKQCDKKHKHKDFESISDYNIRSVIPAKLILEIFNNFETLQQNYRLAGMQEKLF